MSDAQVNGDVTISDRPRFLAKAGVRANYVSDTGRAMRGEGEPVSEDCQLTITRQAHDKQLAAWSTSKRRIEGELTHMRQHVRLHGIDRLTRAISRELAALDRRLL